MEKDKCATNCLKGSKMVKSPFLSLQPTTRRTSWFTPLEVGGNERRYRHPKSRISLADLHRATSNSCCIVRDNHLGNGRSSCCSNVTMPRSHCPDVRICEPTLEVVWPWTDCRCCQCPNHPSDGNIHTGLANYFHDQKQPRTDSFYTTTSCI